MSALSKAAQHGGTPGTAASLRLEPVAAAVPWCRQFVRHHVRRQLPDPVLAERAALLVSELATNAVTHAGTPFVVTVRHADGTVLVEVADERPDGTDAPDRLGDGAGVAGGLSGIPSAWPSGESDGGRGLRIVGELASRWGVRPVADATGGAVGKVVWFELSSGDRAPSATGHPAGTAGTADPSNPGSAQEVLGPGRRRSPT